MCHRYRFQSTVEEAIERFGIDYVDFEWLESKDFYCGKKPVPVIRSSDRHERELVGLQWALIPHWWNPEKSKLKRSWFYKNTFNARSETLHEKNSYRKAFKTQRCILPATEFFEYGNFFHLPGKEAFAIAGLWDVCELPGERIESCSMVTTNANEQVAAVHPRKRMPVLLRDESAIKLWLSPDITERKKLEHLFEPFPDPDMHSYAEKTATG